MEKIVRIAEIEVYPEYLSEYLDFAEEVRNLCQRRRLSSPPENRPFPEIQTRYAQNGEVAQTQHYAANGQGDDEGDVWEEDMLEIVIELNF